MPQRLTLLWGKRTDMAADAAVVLAGATFAPVRMLVMLALLSVPLIMLLRDSHPPAREEAARALVNLAVDDDNKVAIAQAGGVMPLITCLSPRRAYYV